MIKELDCQTALNAIEDALRSSANRYREISIMADRAAKFENGHGDEAIGKIYSRDSQRQLLEEEKVLFVIDNVLPLIKDQFESYVFVKK